MTTKNLVPRATGEGSLGTSAKKWGSIYADNIVLQDGETLATKISSQNSRITTAEGTVTSMEGTVTTLSGDVTSLYSSVETLSSGKVNKENPADSEGNSILTEADVLTLEEIEASTSLADTDVASASALKMQTTTVTDVAGNTVTFKKIGKIVEVYIEATHAYTFESYASNTMFSVPQGFGCSNIKEFIWRQNSTQQLATLLRMESNIVKENGWMVYGSGVAMTNISFTYIAD